MRVVYRTTDEQTVKERIGRRVVSQLIETGAEIRGIFIGFWNPYFAGKNSQTTMPEMPVTFPFNVLTEEGVRIAVDRFIVVN